MTTTTNMHGQTAEIEDIMPERARAWLAEKNVNNRTIAESTVLDYAQQMSDRRWMLNGDAIVFDKDGFLLNGQHRLQACVKSGVVLRTWVVRGVNRESYHTIDVGKRRTPADSLQIYAKVNGIELKYAPQVAALACICIKYEDQKLNNRSSVPRSEIVEYLDKNPDLIGWVGACTPHHTSSLKCATYLGLVAHFGGKAYPEKAMEFIDKFGTGAELREGHPILGLRDKLLNTKRGRKSDKAFWTILAWNSFVEDKPLKRFHIGPARDHIPISGSGG